MCPAFPSCEVHAQHGQVIALTLRSEILRCSAESDKRRRWAIHPNSCPPAQPSANTPDPPAKVQHIKGNSWTQELCLAYVSICTVNRMPAHPPVGSSIPAPGGRLIRLPSSGIWSHPAECSCSCRCGLHTPGHGRDEADDRSPPRKGLSIMTSSWPRISP